MPEPEDVLPLFSPTVLSSSIQRQSNLSFTVHRKVKANPTTHAERYHTLVQPTSQHSLPVWNHHHTPPPLEKGFTCERHQAPLSTPPAFLIFWRSANPWWSVQPVGGSWNRTAWFQLGISARYSRNKRGGKAPKGGPEEQLSIQHRSILR